MFLEILAITSSMLNISVICFIYFKYKNIKSITNYIKMNAEELLENAISHEPNDTELEKKRERLTSLIAGGSGKQYIGKELQISDIDGMPAEEVNKLYCRYEARLGASITKTLGNSLLNLYAMTVARFLPISPQNLPKLIEDLEEDPFINHALTSACCELYYKYGMFLAPVTTILTTAKHINLNNNNNININDGEFRDRTSEETS